MICDANLRIRTIYIALTRSVISSNMISYFIKAYAHFALRDYMFDAINLLVLYKENQCFL